MTPEVGFIAGGLVFAAILGSRWAAEERKRAAELVQISNLIQQLANFLDYRVFWYRIQGILYRILYPNQSVGSAGRALKKSTRLRYPPKPLKNKHLSLDQQPCVNC